jgi:hypothetical protein
MYLLLLGFLTASGPGQASDQPPFMRGMTVSCPTWGPIWGTPQMREALRDLKTLGVQWASIHPYARVTRDGQVTGRPAEELAFLDEATRIARDEGVALMWKPHLAYWGAFKWRGAIEYPDDASWARFFADYERFIVDQARFAQARGVPVFVVGTELEKTVRFEAQWRRVIAKVRAVYGGMIVYAANWDGLARVPFWDAVDLIGVQAYFPLADGEAPPKKLAVERAFAAHLAQLRALSDAQGKKILFTEIGYARSAVAAKEPWKPAEDETESVLRLRRMLLDVALAQMEHEPSLAGAFWWKWMPGVAPWDADFSMKDPEARAALRDSWARAVSRPGSSPGR